MASQISNKNLGYSESSIFIPGFTTPVLRNNSVSGSELYLTGTQSPVDASILVAHLKIGDLSSERNSLYLYKDKAKQDHSPMIQIYV